MSKYAGERQGGDGGSMSDAQLAGIRARADSARNEPWTWIKDDDPPAPGYRFGAVNGMNESGYAYTPTDAAFIAHAREDVPCLLAEVERLIARVQELEEALRGMRKLLRMQDPVALIIRVRELEAALREIEHYGNLGDWHNKIARAALASQATEETT